MNNEKQFLDVNEVSEMLRISRTMIYELMHRVNDPLPYIKFGRRTVIKLSALNEWLERQGA